MKTALLLGLVALSLETPPELDSTVAAIRAEQEMLTEQLCGARPTPLCSEVLGLFWLYRSTWASECGTNQAVALRALGELPPAAAPILERGRHLEGAVWEALNADLDAAAGRRAAQPARTVVEGRLLLPPGAGRRGVELHLIRVTPDGERSQWVQFDEEGRFRDEGVGPLSRVEISAAHRTVYEQVVSSGDAALELAPIDLRALLQPYSVELVPSPDLVGSAARLVVWAGALPRGPMGSLPSLGSAQFPDRALPSSAEWLLPADATDFHILLELPGSPDRGRDWRTGPQQVLGPFTLDTLPSRIDVTHGFLGSGSE